MPTIKKYLDWKGWFSGLYQNVVKAGTGAVLALVGTNAAEGIGVAVKGMDWKQALVAGASVALIEAFRYVHGKPAPDVVVESLDTQVIEK